MELDYGSLEETQTISTEEMLLQVDIALEQLAALAQVEVASWSNRRSISAGIALGNPVHWCLGQVPGTALVFIGPDDEKWSLYVTLPLADVGALVRAAQAAKP